MTWSYCTSLARSTLSCLLATPQSQHGCHLFFNHMLHIVLSSGHRHARLSDGHTVQSASDLLWRYLSPVQHIALAVLHYMSTTNKKIINSTWKTITLSDAPLTIHKLQRPSTTLSCELLLALSDKAPGVCRSAVDASDSMLNSTWKIILLTDANQLKQSNQRHHLITSTYHPEPTSLPNADIHVTTMEELLPIFATAGTASTWVPCSSFLPSVCLIYSTPTISPHWDSMRGAFISPCSRLSPAGAGISDPSGHPTSPPTGPPVMVPSSPPTGSPTKEPTSPPPGPPTKEPTTRKCATKQSKRNRLRRRLMRSIVAQAVRSTELDRIDITIPLELIIARTRPRLLGGALQRSSRTIRNNPVTPDALVVPPLGDDEDWFPLYVLEASRHQTQSEDLQHGRDFIPSSQFVDMTQDAWQLELETLGVSFTNPSNVIHQLLPGARKCAESYERFSLPAIIISSLTLEETLSHIRIVHQRIQRLTRSRNKLQRSLAKKYRQQRHTSHQPIRKLIEDLLHELHRTRTAIVEHNERHQLLQRKAKALVKSTAKKMPRQVFVSLAAPPIPTYNRFQLLSEEDLTHRRTKTWHDFIHSPPPQAPIGAVVDFAPPIPLHQSPPLQRPMLAMAQLRKDLTKYGDPIAHQSPTHTHDVRGWYLTADSHTQATLTVCTWNINGISAGLQSYKAEYIAMIMQQDRIDVMICPDSRHTAATARSLKKIFVDLLGAGTKTYFSDDKARLPGDPGGIAIIVGPRWGPSYLSEHSRTDHSGHGVLTKIQLRTETGYLSVLGTYWPARPHDTPVSKTSPSPSSTDNDTSDSSTSPIHDTSDTKPDTIPYAKKLWPRILEYRKSQKVHDPDPILYLQNLTLTWIAKDRADGCQGFILGGDLNSTWNASDRGGQRTIRHWCEENYFINGPRLIHDRFAPALDLINGISLHFITWGLMDWGWGTWIDHLLHAGDPEHISIHGAFNALGADLDDVSDHKPLWASYITAAPAEARVVPLPKPAKRPEISRTDQRQVAMFKTRISEVMSQLPKTVDTPLEAEEALEYATAYTVQLTREINDQFQGVHSCSHYKRGYSPEFMLRKWHLCTIIELKRHLLGLQGKTRWTSHLAIQRGIFYMFQTLEARAAGMGMIRTDVQRILSSTSLDAKYWLSLPSGPTPLICDSGIKKLKSFLHGRKRMDMRKASSGYSSWVESMREQGKIGRVIKATLGVHAGRRHQDGLTIDAIQTSNGRIQGDPYEIHELTTAHAQASFSIPPECKTPFHTATDWKPYVDDINLFLSAFTNSNIPTRYLHIIHKALQPIPQAAEIHAELELLLAEPPTLEDFKRGIRQTKANSAPGPSGLTNNMTKSWPESMVTYVHSCLSKFWTSTTIPAAQKWKWLHYIPKKTTDTLKLSDLRPLMLIEVLRKHWCTHVATTIKGTLYKHKALEDAHHGYIAGRGTDTASILHINLSEDVEEKTAALHSSSFDLRDAFGSVLNPAIDWCQRRLGIPQIVTRFMASMEEGGTTVVKSGYAQHVWELLPYQCVHTEGAYPVTAHTPLPGSVQISSCHAERGIGQGNPASPDQYLYHDDIIKTGMRLLDGDSKPTFAGAEDNEVFEHPDNGYADDMESASHSAELIQEKAELFSAFNIVLGLKFSPGKIRRHLQDYLPKKLRNHALHMIIYTSGWIPQPIPIATKGSTEYLGGIYDLDNSYSSAMEHMTSIAKLHCNAIKHTHFSAESKILVATTSTVNKLRYTWETSSLSHDQAIKIDAILDSGHVHATKNMLSYPRKLLHIPRYLGGLGIVHFSAAGEMGKLRKLFGCMRSQQKHGSAARGILSRLCRKMGFHSSPGQQIILTSRLEARHERNLYGDSPRQWLESHALHICRHGRTEGFDSISGLLPAILPYEASELRRTCHAMELFNVSDLTEETSTGRQWWSSPDLPEELRAMLPTSIPHGQPPLLVGQYWKLETGLRQRGSFCNPIRAGDVIRIDGRFEDDVICQLYQYRITNKGLRVKLVPGDLRLPISELFNAPFATRCVLVPVTNDVYAIQHARRQHSPAWLSVPDPGPPDWIRWTQQQLSQTMSQSTYIARPYTDGAFKALASVEGYFRPHMTERLATAAIIIKDDTPQWKSKPVIAIRITEGESLDPESVYPMEFLALAGALQLAMFCPTLHDIGSDAQSILTLLPKRNRLLQNVGRDHHYLLQCADNYLFRGARHPYHVRGHAESRKPGRDAHGRLGATWNKDDWGNWIADRLAANDLDTIRLHGIRVTHISISAMEMYRALRTVGQWYIGDITGSPILPKGLAETAARSLAISYYKERDDYRAQGGRSPKWEHDTSMEHAADVFSMRTASVAVAGTKSRTIYDKGYHGGNRAKSDDLTPEERVSAGQCLLCGQPDSQDHWLHHCSNNCMVRIRDDILADLNRIITSYRDINPLHRQLGFAFKHVLMHSEQPSRIWTANWSMEQILLLRRNFNIDLLAGLEMKDLRKILLPLERKLAVGALSLWHTKVCEERRHRPSIERAPKCKPKTTIVNPNVQAAESTTVQQTEAPSAPRRPYLTRASKRKNRVQSQGVTTVQQVTIIQFPRLTPQQLLRISKACHTEKSDSVIVVVEPQHYGSHPIRGIEFQRICPNEKGEKEGNGYFNDGVMAAYLALLQAKMPSQLKVASSWATLQLTRRCFDEVMRALRYGNTRRYQGTFGDHKWIFFIFNIEDEWGKGFHFTAVGINTEARTYTYYDYAKMYSDRQLHMAAVQDFLAYIDSQHPSDRAGWVANLEGTQDMVTQGHYPDCGPGTCFIIEAIASDISLSHFTVEGIHQGRNHFAHCLLTSELPPLTSSLVTTVVTTTQHQDSSAEAAAEIISPPRELITIFHKDYIYDPFCDDADPCLDNVPPEDNCGLSFTIPYLHQDQIREILEKADTTEELVILRPSALHPLLANDLQDLIHPNSITDVLLHQLLLDVYGDRPDILLFPSDMTRLIMNCNGDVNMLTGGNPHADELRALQLQIPTHRFIIFQCWEYFHFVALVADQGDETNSISPQLTYLDSLKSKGERHITSIQRYLTSIRTHQHPALNTTVWTINRSVTSEMIKQRTFRRRHDRPEDAKHIECGIYVLLMVQLHFLQLPLAVLTPTAVHRYRTLLAWQLLHPEHRVPLRQLIVPTASSLFPLTVLPEESTPTQSWRPDEDIFPSNDDDPLLSSQPLPSLCTQNIRSTECHDDLTQPRRLRPRRSNLSANLPSLPNRQHFVFPTNDPASMYTYASTSTIPDAGWGLFMSKPIGPNSPEDGGHIIGEYYGHELSKEDITKYMYEEESDTKTGFMIFFQGLAVNAWDSDKGCYTCMTALINDCLDATSYNAEWVKEKVRGRLGIWVHAIQDIATNGEAFIEYGNLSFCRTSLPLTLLFKAVTHYWSEIMSTPVDRECWSRIPQARTLFNSPYHTCKPQQRLLIVNKIQHHYDTCTEEHCTCSLQQSLMDLAAVSQPSIMKKSRSTLSKEQKLTQSQGPTSPNRQVATVCDADFSPPIIAMPNLTNRIYDTMTIVKAAEDLPGAGLGLYAKAYFKRGDVVGIYENASEGQRLTAHRIKDASHKSQYAVEHGGLVRDAWDPVFQQPCCNTGYINDYHDAAMDNVIFGIHPLQPNKLLVIASKEIHGTDEHHLPFAMPYGGPFWCDDCHSLDLQCRAIRRYNIDIHSSTEATDGDWTKLQSYAQLCEIFPRSTDVTRNLASSIPAVPAVTNKRKASEQGRQPQRHPKHPTQEAQKRKRSVPAPPPKDARQRTLLAYVKTGEIAPAPRIDSTYPELSNVNMSCHEQNMPCYDDFSITMSTELEPITSSLALPNLPDKGTTQIVIESQDNCELISQEDNQARQSSIAPDTQQLLQVSANLSDSPMEYDKRFVFI